MGFLCGGVLGVAPASGIKALSDVVVEVEPQLPPASVFGDSAGDERIALGAVDDRGYSAGPRVVGRNLTQVVLADTREGTVRSAVEHLLRETGLLAGHSEAATLVLDVTILRSRSELRGDRQQAEVFLDFVFRRGADPAGRVLAYGNAQCRKLMPIKVSSIERQVAATYEAALVDALVKLAGSRTLADLLGAGWRAGSLDWAPSDPPIGRIDRELGYGPDIQTWGQGEKLAAALADRAQSRVVLVDLAIPVLAGKTKPKRRADVEAVARAVPDLVVEVLRAFYPGAVPELERRSRWEGGEEALVVEGDVLDAGWGKLTADVRFLDGATRRVLYRLRVDWRLGADPVLGLWTHAVDAIKSAKLKASVLEGPGEGSIVGIAPGRHWDFEDLLAQSLGYMIVRAVQGSFSYPAAAEVRFDDTTYLDLIEATAAAMAAVETAGR